MVLLWGLPGDRPLAAVRHALLQIGCRHAFLDQRDVLCTSVHLTIGAEVAGKLRCCDLAIDLAAVDAVYLRPYDPRQLPCIAAVGPRSDQWQHAMNVDDVLMSWADLAPGLVVNRPSAMASNGSKPYQAVQIQSMGFLAPETLITTDPEAVHEFWGRHQRVIYKSISGVRSIVSSLQSEHCERLADVASCPTQFQQYVAGTDYRVHVIGRELFACRIKSAADDYRYATRAGTTVSMEACVLPDDVADRCSALAASMGLVVAGVDLRCTPEGAWYCFEVNPSPGFTYFQDMTDQPIDHAVARLLAGGVTLRSPRHPSR